MLLCQHNWNKIPLMCRETDPQQSRSRLWSCAVLAWKTSDARHVRYALNRKQEKSDGALEIWHKLANYKPKANYCSRVGNVLNTKLVGHYVLIQCKLLFKCHQAQDRD
jgi:hypothetical protein